MWIIGRDVLWLWGAGQDSSFLSDPTIKVPGHCSSTPPKVSEPFLGKATMTSLLES